MKCPKCKETLDFSLDVGKVTRAILCKHTISLWVEKHNIPLPPDTEIILAEKIAEALNDRLSEILVVKKGDKL